VLTLGKWRRSASLMIATHRWMIPIEGRPKSSLSTKLINMHTALGLLLCQVISHSAIGLGRPVRIRTGSRHVISLNSYPAAPRLRASHFCGLKLDNLNLIPRLSIPSTSGPPITPSLLPQLVWLPVWCIYTVYFCVQYIRLGGLTFDSSHNLFWTQFWTLLWLIMLLNV